MSDIAFDRQIELILDIALLSTATFISRLIFLYAGGMGEADCMVMAAGMAKSLSPDARLADCILYGRQTGPGIYFLFALLRPLFQGNSAHVIPFLNWLGLILATLIVWPLYLLARTVFERRIAVAGIILFLSSPIVWELGTYFHPIVPAALLFLASLFTWRAINVSPRGATAWLATVLLAAAAIVTRTEIAGVVPALVAAALVSKHRWKRIVLLSSVLAAAAAMYLAVIRSIPGPSGAMSGTLTHFISGFSATFRATFSPRLIVKTVPWASLGIGLGTCLAGAAGLFAVRRAWRGLNEVERAHLGRGCIVAAALTVPILAIWLFQPSPILRHFFFVVPAGAYLAGALLLRRLRARALALVTTLAVIGNLAIPDVLYRTYNARHCEAPKEPNGSFFYCHANLSQRIERYHSLQGEIVRFAAEERNAASGRLGAPAGHGDSIAGTEKPRCMAIPANWEIYSYILYGLLSSRGAGKISVTEVAPGIMEHRYALGGADVRILADMRFSQRRIPDELAPILEEVSRRGCTIALPRELVGEHGPCGLAAGACMLY